MTWMCLLNVYFSRICDCLHGRLRGTHVNFKRIASLNTKHMLLYENAFPNSPLLLFYHQIYVKIHIFSQVFITYSSIHIKIYIPIYIYIYIPFS